ncbi:MAG: 30S ribosomal protein S16 [Verrucomicrobiota bacterium]|nr:30S ribosomal protein S16 [Verrucomicrobiota bacterium]
MAVKIRLTRTGTTNAPSYRLVVTDNRNPRDGRYLENLGTYTPRDAKQNSDLKLDRIEHWLSKGAEMTETAASLIKKARKIAVQVA